jgi:holo-[acyl-carrier protein] synthase
MEPSLTGCVVVGVGLDAVDIERFRRSLARTPRLEHRLFTLQERADLARRVDPVPGLAARFAAREAAMKALGVGLGAFGFHDVWVVRASSGAPQLQAGGEAAAVMRRRGVQGFQISLTHTDVTAQAIVLAMGSRPLRCESCDRS